MNIAAPKIVLDTNILIACIGKKSPFRWIFDFLIDGKFILCISNEILFEYHEVLSTKTNQQVAENVVNLLTISPFTEKIDIYFNFELISADPTDNKFVDCAIAANADLLVSNDGHFQVLKGLEFPKVTVLRLSEFEDQYKTDLSGT